MNMHSTKYHHGAVPPMSIWPVTAKRLLPSDQTIELIPTAVKYNGVEAGMQ